MLNRGRGTGKFEGPGLRGDALGVLQDKHHHSLWCRVPYLVLYFCLVVLPCCTLVQHDMCTPLNVVYLVFGIPGQSRVLWGFSGQSRVLWGFSLPNRYLTAAPGRRAGPICIQHSTKCPDDGHTSAHWGLVCILHLHTTLN